MAIAERLKNQLDDVNNRRTVVVALFLRRGSRPGRLVMVRRSFAARVAGSGHDQPGHGRDDARQQVDRLRLRLRAAVERGRHCATDFSKLNVTSSGDGYGPSDQTSFYAKQIPVLHLFTGAHDRYHTPEERRGEPQLRRHGGTSSISARA